MGRTKTYAGVKLGCILRCIYKNGGRDGHATTINRACGLARTKPSFLDADDLGLLATEAFVYFYSNEPNEFLKSKDQLWARLSNSLRGLPESTPEWFSHETRLLDVFPQPGSPFAKS